MKPHMKFAAPLQVLISCSVLTTTHSQTRLWPSTTQRAQRQSSMALHSGMSHLLDTG
jgi:hypothetical protein